MTDLLKLENQLCFRFYHVNKAMTRLYTPVLKALNLTYPQYLVMLVLWQQADAVAIKTLGQRLDLDSGTLSPLLKRMEKLALISRNRSQSDERSVEIKLTEHGRALKMNAKNIPTQMFAKTGLTAEQLTALISTLDQLLNNIND